MVLKLQGKLDEAISHYQKALQINPDYVKAHNNLGSLYLSQRKVDKAITHFRQALQINPDYTTARHNLDIALKLQGKTE